MRRVVAMENDAFNFTQAVKKIVRYSPARTRTFFMNTRATFASTFKLYSNPFSSSSKAWPSYHLFWTSLTPRR